MSRFVRLPLHGTWWLPVLGAPAIVLQFLAAALGFLAIATVVCRQVGFEYRWDYPRSLTNGRAEAGD